MLTFQKVYRILRQKNRGQYALLVFCDFISVLLMTSYAAILRSPTVLNVLPEGGDSRKQIYMIFVLALVGCAKWGRLWRSARPSRCCAGCFTGNWR